MTTIIGLITKKAVFLGADTQITSGNLALPTPAQKIHVVGRGCAVAQTGALSGLQQVLKRSMRQIWIHKIMGNDMDLQITPKELAEGLSDFNFEMPLEFKDYSPAEYLLAGYEDDKPVLASISSDGGVVDAESFFASGSGGSVALGLLQSRYSADLSDEEAAVLIQEVLLRVSSLEINTGCGFGVDVYMLKPDDGSSPSVTKWKFDDAPTEPEKPVKEEEMQKLPAKNEKKGEGGTHEKL